MHAHLTVQRFVDTHLSLMHAARRKLLCAAVAAAMAGHALRLSRLARAVAVTGPGPPEGGPQRIRPPLGLARLQEEDELTAPALPQQPSPGGGNGGNSG